MPHEDRSTRGPMMTGGTPLRTLDEDDLLELILPLFGGGRDLLVAPGDDAAVLRTTDRTVATTDTAVLGRDWLDAWSSGADIGHKVIASNLADVAAMGGTPTGVLVTLVADPLLSLEWVLDHAAGLGGACAEAEVAVLGGDLSSAPAGVVMVSVTALGRLDGPAVLRSGARIGDVVAVCGTLGLAAAGLLLLESGQWDRHPLAVERQRRPVSPLAAGPVAARAGATSMLDISDGLVRDGSRIARASGVVLAVDLDGASSRTWPSWRVPWAGRPRSTACSPAGRSTPSWGPSPRVGSRSDGAPSVESPRRGAASPPSSSTDSRSRTPDGTTSAPRDHLIAG